MILDEELITDYYKSLIVKYEQIIDKEKAKLNAVEKKYLCYLCREKNTNALNSPDFFVDTDEHKIVCRNCIQKKKLNYVGMNWN